MKLTKRRKFNATLVQGARQYDLNEAVSLIKKAAPVKFDATVDLQFKLNADPAASDQALRGTVVLPNGTGRKIRVIVLSKDERGKEALQAGADEVGAAELVEKIEKGWFEFDVMVASPAMMREVGRLGKLLGPRGLMPSPKAGTVTEDLAQAVREVKKGRIEFKMDKQANLNCAIGKVSFSDDKIVQNVQALIEAVNKAKPKTVRGDLIGSVTLSSTMGPGLKLQPSIYKVKETAND